MQRRDIGNGQPKAPRAVIACQNVVCLFVQPGPRSQPDGLDEGTTNEKLGSVGCSNEVKAAKINAISLFATEKAESRMTALPLTNYPLTPI